MSRRRGEPTTEDWIWRWIVRRGFRRLDRALVGVGVFGLALAYTSAYVTAADHPTKWQTFKHNLAVFGLALLAAAVVVFFFSLFVAYRDRGEALRDERDAARDERDGLKAPPPMRVRIREREPLNVKGDQARFFRLIVEPEQGRQVNYRTIVERLDGEDPVGYAEAPFTCSWRDGDNQRAVPIAPGEHKMIDLAQMRRLQNPLMSEIELWYPKVDFKVFQGPGIPAKDEPAPARYCGRVDDLLSVSITADVVVFDDDAGVVAGKASCRFFYELSKHGIYEPCMEIVESTPRLVDR